MNNKEKTEKFVIDDYTVCSKNNKHTISFKASNGNLETVNVEIKIKEEFDNQKKKYKSQQNKIDRHIEKSQLTENTLNKRAIHKVYDIEDFVIENENIFKIVKEILSLPSPQNKRVYMKIINQFSLTDIAKIEGKSIPVIKRSIDRGIAKLQKNLKNFYFRGKK